MRVKRENVLAALLLVGALIMWANYRHTLATAVSTIGHIAPGNEPTQPWAGAIVLFVLCFTVACIVKLLTNRRP